MRLLLIWFTQNLKSKLGFLSHNAPWSVTQIIRRANTGNTPAMINLGQADAERPAGTFQRGTLERGKRGNQTITAILSIEGCPQDGLEQFFAMGTYRVDLTKLTFRFRHFGAAFAGAKEKPIHGALALT